MNPEGEAPKPVRRVRFRGSAGAGEQPREAGRPTRVRFIGTAMEGGPASAWNRSQPPGPHESGSTSAPEINFPIGNGDTVTVTVPGNACAALARHCGESRAHGREVGGVLVGFRGACPGEARGTHHHVVVTDLIPIASRSSSGSHVRFDELDWEFVEHQMQSVFAPAGKCRLGWYHTHPTQGLFFSSYDRDAHTVFQQPFQFALVVDPAAMEAGLFHWYEYGRRLGGPLRFSLVPPAEVRRGHVGRVPGWAAVAALGAAAATALVSAVFPRAGWMNAGLIAASALAAAACWSLGLLDRSERGFSGFWKAAGLLTVALVTFAAGTRLGRQASAALPGNIETPGNHPAELREPGQPSRTQAPASHRRARVRLVVTQKGRGRTRQVVLESPERSAKIAYRIQDCPKTRTRGRVRWCRIDVNIQNEQRFLQTIFRVPGTQADAWRPLQQSLGMEEGQVDGRWGRRTRVRFLEHAVSSLSSGPLRVRLQNIGPAEVVFEPARTRRAQT